MAVVTLVLLSAGLCAGLLTEDDDAQVSATVSLLQAPVQAHDLSSYKPMLLHKLSTTRYPNALCLDGTQGAYYARGANEVNASKWVISLMGGGHCDSEQSCMASSKSFTSTSPFKYMPDELRGGDELIKHDEDENPDFYGWNHVRVLYCSRDYWSGTMNSTSPKRWGKFYFSGDNIFRAVLDDLYPSLAKAEMIVLSGESSGGMGVLTQLDYVKDLLPNVFVAGAARGGFLLEATASSQYSGEGAIIPPTFGSTLTDYESMYTLYAMRVPWRCEEVNPDTPWACLIPSISSETLETPVFMFQFLFDFVLMGIFGMPYTVEDTGSLFSGCSVSSASQRWCHSFSTNMSRSLKALAANPSKHGVFAPSCNMHIGFEGVLINNTRYMHAFRNWFFDGVQSMYLDEVPDAKLQIPPGSNPTCSVCNPSMYC